MCPVSINKPENKSSGCSISNDMIDCKLPVSLVSVSPVSNYEPECEMSTSPVSLNESDVEPCPVSIYDCDNRRPTLALGLLCLAIYIPVCQYLNHACFRSRNTDNCNAPHWLIWCGVPPPCNFAIIDAHIYFSCSFDM